MRRSRATFLVFLSFFLVGNASALAGGAGWLTDYEKAGPMLERAAELNPDSPRVWLDLYSYYQRNMQLERGFHAYARAQELAAGQPIVQDPPTGLWRLESDSIYP